MSTAAKLDSSVSSGLDGFRARMQKVQASIKESDERTKDLEKQKIVVQKHYCKIIGKQQAIRSKITTTEESIESIERKIKELTARTLEKEQFLKESKKFATNLKIVAPNESEIQSKESRLQKYKSTYHKSYERYQKAKSKKIELEQEFEIMEGRSLDAQRRLREIQTELEYNLVEESRRSEGCKKAIDDAFKEEKSCLALEKGLTSIMRRKEIATNKIKQLESKIQRAENAVETTNYEKRRIEATIREILIGAKDQYKDVE